MTKEQKDCDCTPCLRFPEFVGGKKWRKISLGELADRNIRWSFSGGPFGSNLKSSDYTESGIRIIQLQNIGDSCFLDNYKIFTSKQKADELLSCNIYPGEIILAKMGDPVARSCIVPTTEERYLMCSDGIRLVVDKNNYSSTFTFYLINSKYFRKKAEEKSTGSTRKRIGLDELKSIPIFIPILQEQKKIADCLSSLDELIEAHEQKLDALKQHKKGLMQHLFPVEGETTPRWRFPEFRNAGEWEKYEIGDIFTATRGQVLAMTEVQAIKTKNFSYPVYSSQTKNNGLAGYYSDYLYENAITWTTDGANAGEVNFRKGKFYCTNVCGVLLNKDGYANKCISEIINFVSKKYVSYVGNPKLMNNVMKKIKITIPSLPEQQKIADCLTSLDERIEAQEEKIATLKEHKKGLMQQLFPSL